jgi:GNAT superfamily N-acetyltransferase
LFKSRIEAGRERRPGCTSPCSGVRPHPNSCQRQTAQVCAGSRTNQRINPPGCPERRSYALGLNIRKATRGDGAAIAKVHRDSAAYYVGLAPELFRTPDDDGLVAFAEPGPDDNSSTTLFIVAEVDDEIVGHLYAEVIAPDDSDRFQSTSDLQETRLFIQALAVLQSHWRQGIASALVEAAEAWGRERGATVALCDTWTGSPVSLPFWEQHMKYEGRSIRLRKRLTS